MVLSDKKKKDGRYCCAYGCTNEPIKKKGGLCHKHYERRMRTRNPVETRYKQFKGNARRRGIVFTITLSQFRKFCDRTGYIKQKGRRGYSATIDRLCNAHGYHIWNIGIKTNRANSSKGNRFNGDKFECPF